MLINAQKEVTSLSEHYMFFLFYKLILAPIVCEPWKGSVWR